MKVWDRYAYTVTGGGDQGQQPEGRIIDLADPANPAVVGAFPSAHNIFIDTRGSMYLEGPGLRIFDLNADVTAWDIQDPGNPVLVAEIGDSTATVHNLFILDNLAYLSYYTAGFRLYDVSDPTLPRLLDECDTAQAATGAGFDEAWGVYPFTPSGHIYVSDMEGGLYIFALER